MARDRRLALELRLQLQRLESLPPTTPIATIEQTLSSEIGSLEKAGVVLHPPALAEASVAVVLPFTCAAASRDGLPPRGVFKVLKPGIEERLARELSLLEDVGSLLDDRCAAFGIPPLEYREVFEQVREKLGTEVDLGGEQRHLNEAADTYAAEPEVLIPKLFPGLCTARVTAMERVDGHKVTEPGKHDAWDRRRLAELIVEALVAGPIWSEAPCATFHADPHAGNLFVTPDRRLAILDWSLTGALGEDERVAITQIVMGGLSLNSAAGPVGPFESGFAAAGRRDHTQGRRRALAQKGSRGKLSGLLVAHGNVGRRRAPRPAAGRHGFDPLPQDDPDARRRPRRRVGQRLDR